MLQHSISARRAAHSAGNAAGPGTEWLARLGYVAKGLVYVIIGVLAARVAVGDGGKTTDTKGALTTVYQQPFGQVLLIAVMVGLVGYALWCFLRSFLDADNRGSDAKGIIARVAFALVGVVYLGLTLASYHLLNGGGTGKSSDKTTQDWTAKLLQQSYGQAVIVLAGLVVLGVAAYFVYYAYSAEFLKRFKPMDHAKHEIALRFGQIGYLAQAIVFAEIGAFLIVAAQKHNAHDALGIGGSLNQLAHEPYGHFLLAIVAVGFVIYGLFSFMQARYRQVHTT